MSLKRKRSSNVLCESDPDLLIITADGEQGPLKAHFAVLAPFSEVVASLPRAGDNNKVTWDLSGIILEGESGPVSSAVVRSWLDLVYSRVDLTRVSPSFTSLSEAARSLLLFADAVGTCGPVLQGLGEGLSSQPGLTLPVEVKGAAAQAAASDGTGNGGAAPTTLTVELPLRGHVCYVIYGSLYELKVSEGSRTIKFNGQALAPYKKALPAAVAAALERWLYLAGRLGLVPLARMLLDFFKTQLVPRTLSLFAKTSAAVFSRRVLECMPRELLVEGFVTGCLNDPLVGKADLAAGSKLNMVLASPEAAAWFSQKLDAQVENTLDNDAGVFRVDSNALGVALRFGSMPHAQQQRVVREVLQRLEGEAEE